VQTFIVALRRHPLHSPLLCIPTHPTLQKGMSLAALHKYLKEASEEATTLSDKLKNAEEKCKKLQKQLDKANHREGDDKKAKRKEEEEPSGSSAKKTKSESADPPTEEKKKKAPPRCTICKELMAGNDHTSCKKVKADKKAARAAEREKKLREGKNASESESSSE